MRAEAIIDAVLDIGRIAQRRDEIERLRQRALRRCGGCRNWMKTLECPAEANGVKPSMNALPCSRFEATSDQLRYEREFDMAQRGEGASCPSSI